MVDPRASWYVAIIFIFVNFLLRYNQNGTKTGNIFSSSENAVEHEFIVRIFENVLQKNLFHIIILMRIFRNYDHLQRH